MAILNNLDRSVRFTPCLVALERQVDGHWRKVWAALCLEAVGAAPAYAEVEIPPEGVHFAQIRLANGVQEPEWLDPLAGVYRLEVAIGDAQRTLSEWIKVRSGPFVLHDA